jgi:hypothetical protein
MLNGFTFNTHKPTVSALYLVDRGPQGRWYRWYNAQTDQWGRCGIDMDEAVQNKDKTALDFFPWVGPLTGPNFATNKPVVEVTDTPAPKATKSDKMAQAVVTAASKTATKKKMAKMRGVKQVIGDTKVYSIMKSKAKIVHPDGTVWFREDRQKWVAQWNGKQEAARPTAEACLKFLTKKYGVTGTVIPKE